MDKQCNTEIRKFQTVQISHVNSEINSVAIRLTHIGHTTTTTIPDNDNELQVIIRKEALGWSTNQM